MKTADIEDYKLKAEAMLEDPNPIIRNLSKIILKLIKDIK